MGHCRCCLARSRLAWKTSLLWEVCAGADSAGKFFESLARVEMFGVICNIKKMGDFKVRCCVCAMALIMTPSSCDGQRPCRQGKRTQSDSCIINFMPARRFLHSPCPRSNVSDKLTDPSSCPMLDAATCPPRSCEGRIAGVCFILHLASCGTLLLSLVRLLMDAGGRAS